MVLSRIDPLKALVGFESVVVALAFVGDAAVIALQMLPSAPSVQIKSAYFLVAALTAWAIFAIPHTRNRRYVIVGLAVAGISAVRAFPQHSMIPLALLLTFVARVVFAFGLRGLAIACLAELLSVASFLIPQHLLGYVTMREVLFESYFDLVIFAFIFGLIWITLLYADKASNVAAASERMRIALDLHDSLGHRLTTLNVQLQNIERFRIMEPEKADAYVRRASATAAEALSDVRETVALLHDGEPIARPPLPKMLDRLYDEFIATHGIELISKTRFAVEPEGRTAMAIYRVLQEALTNVARHAAARRVRVSIKGSTEAIDVLVHDDGVGFDHEVADGHGLASMRSRIESVGGTLTVASVRGRGTEIKASVPMEAPA